MRLLMLLLTLILLTCGCSREETSPDAKTAAEPATKPAETSQVVQQAEQLATQVEEKAAQMTEEAQQQVEKLVDEGQDKMAQAEEKMAAMVSEASPAGQTIFTKNCAACHKLGLMGAPKIGDKSAWEPLIASGIDPLVANSINGKGQMPAKGGNSQLTDAEVRAAVEYMVEQSR